MSHHAYSRCWLHLVWATHEREQMLPQSAAAKVSSFLTDYATEKGIYTKINYVNADHVHALIDLPTNLTMEDAAQLLKGGSSYWINDQKLVTGRFSWGRGYGAFSVSQSDVSRVAKYISGQEEHHRTKTFADEYKRLIEVYGLAWRSEKTVETVREVAPPYNPSLKRGVNESRNSLAEPPAFSPVKYKISNRGMRKDSVRNTKAARSSFYPKHRAIKRLAKDTSI